MPDAGDLSRQFTDSLYQIQVQMWWQHFRMMWLAIAKDLLNQCREMEAQ